LNNKLLITRIDQLNKESLEFQIYEFLDLLQEFDSNSIEFGFAIIRIWLNHMINT
jgi:hypothetical protein